MARREHLAVARDGVEGVIDRAARFPGQRLDPRGANLHKATLQDTDLYSANLLRQGRHRARY